VIQYEVRLPPELDCGGAYLKLISSLASTCKRSEFSADTPYIIMFGPDKCGIRSRVQLIIQRQNPINKLFYSHLFSSVGPLMKVKIDRFTHLYTLHVKTDNTINFYIDQDLASTANMLTDFDPRIVPFGKEVLHNFYKMIGVGFEIWALNSGIMFDNILITYNKTVADDFAAKTWAVKHRQERRLQQEEMEKTHREELIALHGFFGLHFIEFVEFVMENYILATTCLTAGLFPVFLYCMMPCSKPATKNTNVHMTLQAQHNAAHTSGDKDGVTDEIVVGTGKVKEVRKKQS